MRNSISVNPRQRVLVSAVGLAVASLAIPAQADTVTSGTTTVPAPGNPNTTWTVTNNATLILQSGASSNWISLSGMLLHELRYPSTYTPQWRCAYTYDAGTAGTPGRCSRPGAMPASVAGFQAFVNSRQSARGAHNEIILAAWPLDIPNDLPLQAFFYQFDATRRNAQSIQQDYMGRTGHFMPVVAMRLPMAPGSIFRYVPAEQTGAMSTTAVGN